MEEWGHLITTIIWQNTMPDESFSTLLLLLEVLAECLSDDDYKRIMRKLDERLVRKIKVK